MCLSPEVRARLAAVAADLEETRAVLNRWAEFPEEAPDEDEWGACRMTEEEHRQVAGRLRATDYMVLKQ